MPEPAEECGAIPGAGRVGRCGARCPRARAEDGDDQRKADAVKRAEGLRLIETERAGARWLRVLSECAGRSSVRTLRTDPNQPVRTREDDLPLGVQIDELPD